MAKRGRPTIYSEAIAEKICSRLLKPETLLSICSKADMPSRPTIYRWTEEHPEFQKKLSWAREHQAHAFFDQIIDIADDDTVDPQSRRVRVEARKWYISRVCPKKFGDKIDVGVQEDDPFAVFLASIAGRVLKPVENGDAAAESGADALSGLDSICTHGAPILLPREDD